MSNNSPFSTFLQLPPQENLSPEDIRHLFDLVDWGIVLDHPRVGHAYGNYPPESMFKALSLPFLIVIPTERSLARELKEKGILRIICGFESQPPTRGMLWNFRHTPRDFYSVVMPQVLIALGAAGKRLNLSLPFVSETRLDDEFLIHAVEWELFDATKTRVKVWLNSKAVPLISVGGKKLDEAAKAYKRWQKSATHGVDKQLQLPMKVRLCNLNYDFIVNAPIWLDSSRQSRLSAIDNLTGIYSLPADSNIACSILVIRKSRGGSDEILLSKRLNGYGVGEYSLPGGRKMPGETLQQCIKRELFEETGMHLLSSRPVSIKFNYRPTRQMTVSIGSLATKFKGSPKRREEKQNSKWEWFLLDELPTPLFEPTRLIIDDYKRQRFNLSWEDIEKQLEHSHREVLQQHLIE